jgi:hypothetical protein
MQDAGVPCWPLHLSALADLEAAPFPPSSGVAPLNVSLLCLSPPWIDFRCLIEPRLGGLVVQMGPAIEPPESLDDRTEHPSLCFNPPHPLRIPSTRRQSNMRSVFALAAAAVAALPIAAATGGSECLGV